MENSGGGATFTDHDLDMAKRIVGLLNKATYNLGSQMVLEAAEAMRWYVGSLIPGIEKNIFEIKAVSQPVAPPEGSSEAQ